MELLTGVQNLKLVWKCSFRVCHPNFFSFSTKSEKMAADYVPCRLQDTYRTVTRRIHLVSLMQLLRRSVRNLSAADKMCLWESSQPTCRWGLPDTVTRDGVRSASTQRLSTHANLSLLFSPNYMFENWQNKILLVGTLSVCRAWADTDCLTRLSLELMQGFSLYLKEHGNTANTCYDGTCVWSTFSLHVFLKGLLMINKQRLPQMLEILFV